MSAGERVAEAALAAVGARFRLHGRSVADGLDCVGLAALALHGAGYDGVVPTGYALRGGEPGAVVALLDRALVRVGREGVGDLLLCVAGPGQLHLAVRVEGGIVHADAGLRRVVMRPGPVPWPVIGAWAIGG